MKSHFLLAGVFAVAFVISAPEASAHGGGGHGGGSGSFHGGWHSGGFHGRHFFHGRFSGSGFSYYGYPWWDWGYPYYPYAYDGYDGYYSDSGPNDAGRDSRLSSPRAVQASLAWRGFYSGRIDGVVGPETRSAIRSFQSHQGLPMTGQIDGRLIDALRR
jgi:hypothetical protein